ncbi:hypothetical protein PVL29_000561 [Vitis rotundifolia]|uniref:B box-type domain-containing protein n=1 Tax=Vitis rotundifolia TaxID=103349 RepID=A0AA39AJ48_VITRO|nr:hypothetical protein PVL29_000561 [Vitis rotundifolia]
MFSPLFSATKQDCCLNSPSFQLQFTGFTAVGCRILLKNKADWLSTLLHSKFFDTCGDHRDLRKSEKNVFCIDCNLCFCKHCVTSSGHCLHRRLKICKYVYHDVVRLQDMQQHLDCSKIQTYKINGEKAVHLNPRPQSKDCKTSKPKGGASCEACGRYIQDLPNRFCSIACKVLIFAEKFKDHNSKVVPFPVQEFAHLSLKESVDTEIESFVGNTVGSVMTSSFVWSYGGCFPGSSPPCVVATMCCLCFHCLERLEQKIALLMTFEHEWEALALRKSR